jgi:hypothetical protein
VVAPPIANTDIGIAIKTIDRSPKHNYLQETCENLRRALGTPPVEARPQIVISDGHGLTLHQGAAKAIQAGVDLGTPWVLVLEDDLDFCDDFLGSVARWLMDHAEDRYPMYVFGASYPQVVEAILAGRTSWEYPVGAFYGAQALCWKREVAEQLVQWLGPDPAMGAVKDRGHDLLLGRGWAPAIGATHFLASCPSFVQHIGRQSSLDTTQFFQFPWPGRGWCYMGRAGEGTR